MEYQEVTKRDWKKVTLYILLIIIFVTAGSVLLVLGYWYVGTVLMVIGAVVPIYLSIKEEKGEVYKCPKCQHEFEISALRSLITPHGITKKEGKVYDWKYLECPMCHDRSKMFRVKRKKERINPHS